MDKYKIKINPRAEKDLDSIYNYIAYEKMAFQNAKAQADRIKEAILSLDTFPQAHQERGIGKYADKGYRQLLIDEYIVIYRICETEKTVNVVTIQYQGRNI